MIEPASDSDLEAAYLNDGREPPWLYVNMVTTIDGATSIDGRSSAIGDDQDTVVFRALRATADLVLVAAGTARGEGYKKPRLPPHLIEWRRDHDLPELPRIAVVSGSLDFDVEPFGDAPPLVVTDESAPPARRRELERVTEVVVAGGDRVDLRRAVERLRADGFGRILSEGGPSLNGQLVAADLIDEWCLTISPLVVGGESSRIVAGPEVSSNIRAHRLVRVMTGSSSLFTRWVRDG